MRFHTHRGAWESRPVSLLRGDDTRASRPHVNEIARRRMRRPRLIAEQRERTADRRGRP